jgi:hypothetical protein
MATRTAVCRGKHPGLLITFADYAAAPGIHFSTLRYMAQSPLHYLHALNNPLSETQAMLLGRAVHCGLRATPFPDRLRHLVR